MPTTISKPSAQRDSSVKDGGNERGPESRGPLALLCLTAIGVVYGDIGTSPLYAIRECFFGPHGIPVNEQNVLGVLSLIVWTLVLVVTLKYHVYVIRADNEGEGGILALSALATRKLREHRWLLAGIGLFGAALLYGDGMITPAISVLSAVEGLDVATPRFSPYVVPITIIILIALFAFQRRGTSGVGMVFGPVILVWFATLAFLGITGIARAPQVLEAFNPVYAVRFFLRNGVTGYLVLGAVFLVATGGEALYADLGHFGEKPIQIDWFSVVAPCLLLNYFGQGALLLVDPSAAHNPFYRLAPAWALYPLLLLATMATIIASQAVISGVFSLTRQAVQLGYLPRLKIVHTWAKLIGQIYVPIANWGLMLATVALVVGFQTSSNLAAAYGVAVSTTMVITTVLAFVVARRIWKWPLWVALPVSSGFLVVDLAFFGANIVKVAQGGWFPLLIAAAVFLVFSSWRRGRKRVAALLSASTVPAEKIVEEIAHRGLARVDGTAIFLTGDTRWAPVAFLHNIKHNKALHERNVFLTLESTEDPHVLPENRTTIESLGSGFYRVIGHFGFMDFQDVSKVLRDAWVQGLSVDPQHTTFILSRTTFVIRAKRFVPGFLDWLFVSMARRSSLPTDFFGLPPGRVIELGMVVEL